MSIQGKKAKDLPYARLLFRQKDRHFATVVFARAHASRAADAERPAGRTLFLANLPLSATGSALRSALEAFGPVDAVHMDAAGGVAASPRRSQQAHVVFAAAPALRKCLKCDRAIPLSAGGGGGGASSVGGTLGDAPEDRETLGASVAAFLQQFEADEASRARAAESAHGAMDEDGFVLVTRKAKGRSVASDGTVSMGAASDAATAARAAKRVASRIAHERKRDKLLALREQFEADKARVAKLRADRKFRPY
ncbi:hypothetical protein EMIHUDRAFT_448353 [Emiliania huxleyi CCMP1516]|uniref:Ribosomal RNA-processing protein 7 C-terminal domain-containing protein n=2 Tax=Emiliania huxleyi TaxID=2903 RepID=A0A0D3IDT0_EMIH1|nr:hypothetical protein EMIHUDRAFT_448353 [Emiliania huxleyi CCMP1516]EOD09415.1 hypothetical protein EMIHUDRAFT_448353 [Emiliania huxleyi CCMP1516]|eukprot:XP_005761844.1 hypothetical protein EMIHUDRAFT_448353 [Emiliania huxleyi CCMP1516]